MKRIIIGLALAAMTISGGIAVATPSRGYVATALGWTTIDELEIEPSGESVVLFVLATIEPAGTTGWHSHPADVFVLVRQGRVAVTDGHTCTRTVYTEGEVFVETPGHVHKASNVGDEQVRLRATFVGLPPDTPPTTDEADPCGPDDPEDDD